MREVKVIVFFDVGEFDSFCTLFAINDIMYVCDALGAIGLAADIVIVVMQRSFVSCLIASLSVI